MKREDGVPSEWRDFLLYPPPQEEPTGEDLLNKLAAKLGAMEAQAGSVVSPQPRENG